MKLNKEMREAICKNAMHKTGLIDELKALIKRYAAFAEKCRLVANGGLKDARLEKLERTFMAKIPEKLLRHTGSSKNHILRRDHYVNLSLQGMCFQAYFSGSSAVPDHMELQLYVSKSMLCPTSLYRYCPDDRVYIDDPALVQEFTDLESAKQNLADKIFKAKQSVSAYVYSVTTAERLVKVWPEAAALIPKDAAETGISNLPAIPVTDMNKMFNLP
jgi:hypothetical protein